METCPHCLGSGKDDMCLNEGEHPFIPDCDHCDGAGLAPTNRSEGGGE